MNHLEMLLKFIVCFNTSGVKPKFHISSKLQEMLMPLAHRQPSSSKGVGYYDMDV